MIPLQEFYFLRHGETDWNAQRRCQGQTDIPLNEFGRWQAECAAKHLKGCPIRAIISSPLLRARETADIVRRLLPSPLHLVADFAEMNLGEDEGAIHGPWLDAWRRGEYCPKGGEHHQAFVARCRLALKFTLSLPGPSLIIAHGGVFWAIEILLKHSLGRTIQNGEIIHCYPKKGRWLIGPAQTMSAKISA